VKCIVNTCAFVVITMFINAAIGILIRQGIQFAVCSVKFTLIYSHIFNIFSNNILSFLAPKPATFMYSHFPSVG
jgi:hypothetical protein